MRCRCLRHCATALFVVAPPFLPLSLRRRCLPRRATAAFIVAPPVLPSSSGVGFLFFLSSSWLLSLFFLVPLYWRIYLSRNSLHTDRHQTDGRHLNLFRYRRGERNQRKKLRNAIILVQGHCFIDKGERFGNKDPSTETEHRESSYSHPMKYTGFGVEDFNCQDRGRKTNIFTWISSTFKIDIDTVEGL